MCILFHNWGQWKIIETGNLLETSVFDHQSKPVAVGNYIVQRIDCGKAQLDTQEVIFQ